MDKEEGIKLVKLARKAIEYFMHTGKPPSETIESSALKELRGVFVTLKKVEGNELRGCIGFPLPTHPLWKATMDGALNAAFNDPRFPPMGAAEIDKVTVEVSVLSKPEEVEGPKNELPRKIEIGTDGLMLEKQNRKALLLPQVATEQNWNAEQFLEELCQKANLLRTDWKKDSVKIFKFQAQIFREVEPRGQIVEE
jgi:AmmeMemoRadiSam system protein A